MRGGWPSLPRPIEQALFCIPILLVSLSSPWYIALLAYALSVAAVCKGHGRNMDLGHSHKKNEDVEPEWYEFTVSWLQPHLSEYWYDVIGVSISGLTYTLPLLLTNPIMAPVGLLKGPAYMIGWTNKMPSITIGKFTLKHETEWGEFLTGEFIWDSLLILFLLSL